MNRRRHAGAAFIVLLTTAAVGCAAGADGRPPQSEQGWRKLFDGRTLDGWTTKIAGYPAGQDPLETFRVKDGAIYITYDKYGGNMHNRWAHLFYKEPFKAYRLTMEYRFVGEETPNTPPRRTPVNSGILYHAQSPQSMLAKQLFPISVEAQILGPFAGLYRDGKPRKTASACSMGTLLGVGDKPPQDCVSSDVTPKPFGVWVRFDLEVRPDGHVTQSIDGKPVAEFDRVYLDPSDARFPAQQMIDAARGNRLLNSGYIALQSEGHPVEFRDIRVLPLE